MKVMLLVGVGIDQVALPGGERRAVDPIDPVNAGGVKLHVRQVLASVPGQRGIGVQMHHPILDLEMSQADVDRQRLREVPARAKYGQKAVRMPYRWHTAIVPVSPWDVTTTQSSKSDWLTRMVCSRKSS